MKKLLTNKMMEADIRKAKANIFDSKMIDKLKENLAGAWKPLNSTQVTNEEHHLLHLAHYLVEVSALAETTRMLKGAIESANHKKTKELLYHFKSGLKTLPIRGEEDQAIFYQIQKELEPLLATLKKSTDHHHLFTHAENLMHMIHQKLEPQKWKHAA